MSDYWKNGLGPADSPYRSDLERLDRPYERRAVTEAFLQHYLQAMSGVPSMPPTSEANALIDFFTLEKAVYEVDYELAQRPTWLTIPLSGVLALLGPERKADGSA